METMSIVWLVLIVVLLAFEGFTAGLISIWFAIGSIAAFIVSLFMPDSIVIQFAAFFVISTLTLIITRPLVKKIMPRQKKPLPTVVERVIGRRAMVTKAITKDKPGRIFVDGQSWAAECETPLEVDAICIVTAIEGATLIVKPEEK